MARVNQRLQQAMSSGEPSTAAETLNNTVARNLLTQHASMITADTSQLNNCTEQQISIARSNRTQLDSSMLTPNSFSKRQSKSHLKQGMSTASTMNNTLQANELKLKLIKPKQYKNTGSKVDSGLNKNKK